MVTSPTRKSHRRILNCGSLPNYKADSNSFGELTIVVGQLTSHSAIFDLSARYP